VLQSAGEVGDGDDVPAPAPAVLVPAPAIGPLCAATPPVDMERLLDFTEGNPESMKELVDLYLSQTEQQVRQLAKAVRDGSSEEVRRVAHSCAGASATCGMGPIVPLLRELERQGHEGRLTNAEAVCAEVEKEFDRIQTFLNDYQARRRVRQPVAVGTESFP
jgi:HPt (histidine-containing phosphotransfer) domain-containing protein